jgi:uncharacterized delta-60 repeat protein
MLRHLFARHPRRNPARPALRPRIEGLEARLALSGGTGHGTAALAGLHRPAHHARSAEVGHLHAHRARPGATRLSGARSAAALPMISGGVTYGPPGTITTDFGPGTNAGAAPLLIQPDGKIIAAGSAKVVSPYYPQEFGLARYNADGSLDTSFGSGGLVTTQFPFKGTSGNTTWINGLALQSDGKILAAGGYNGAKGSGNGSGESFG